METLAVTDCVMERDTYVDDIGRIFCLAHKRAICHICCFNFEMMNEMAEATRIPPKFENMPSCQHAFAKLDDQ